MSVHVSSIKLYLAVFGALLILTAGTVAIAFVDLGRFNDLLALAIATIKATLVVLFFMHVRHSSLMTKLAAISGFVWLFILFGLTLSDYLTRSFLR